MNRIKEFRNNLQISQAELAFKCKWSASRIGNYEVGSRTPSLNDCRVLAETLSKLSNRKICIDDIFPPNID